MELEKLIEEATEQIKEAARVNAVRTPYKREFEAALRVAIGAAIGKAYIHGVTDGKAESYANW